MLEYDLLQFIFDIVRIVDPRDKSIIRNLTKNKYELNTINHCYDFWLKDKICDNCIAMRSIRLEKSIAKVEMEGDKVFLIIASPYEYKGKIMAIELVKDITDTNIFINIKNKKEQDVDYKSIIEELNKAIITDELTDIYNKRYVLEHLPYDIQNNLSNNKFTSIVMLDIDYFKKINDSYGHIIGDKVLKSLAEILKNQIRSNNDYVARFGGEEFLLVFNEIDIEALYDVCNRIRIFIENKIFYIDGYEINFTVSMGGAVLKEKSFKDLNDILDFADKLLYKAKEDGRNICYVDEYKN
ncbi:MAG: GGDEF domain-containing protein [Peptostreptococcaceae bacterium]|nr:GGDEF domain-containing protein [Peptostreptococcaceae bacterium]